jgi:hypothetical protein
VRPIDTGTSLGRVSSLIMWALAGPALFKDNADRLDVFVAFGPIAERQLHGAVPETLTAVGAWIVLPTLVGLWASSRREVK